MTTQEFSHRDEDVTHEKKTETDSSDNKSKREKKKKKKERKTQKDEQKKDTESDAEHCVMEDEETPRKKKKKDAKLFEGADGDNCKGGPDSGKEKKKKKHKSEGSLESSLSIDKEKKRKRTKSIEVGSQENVHEGGSGSKENEDIGGLSERPVSKGPSSKEEVEIEIGPCEKKDKEMSRKKKKKAKLSEGIDEDNCEGEPDSGKENGKEKKKKKKESEDSIEKKRKKTKPVEGESRENGHEEGLGSKENVDIGGPYEKLVSKGSSRKEEIEIEIEPCEKKDEEMSRKKKKKAKLFEGIDEDNCEGELDSGKEKKKKKKESEDSIESSSHINKEKKRKKTKYVEGESRENVHERGLGSKENGDIGGPSERLVSTGSSKKEEIETETETCQKKDEETSRKKKNKAKLAEGIDGDSCEGVSDSGKEKKKKKQKSEDSIESSLYINKEKKRKRTKYVESGSEENAHEGGSGSRENEDIGSPSERLVSPGSSKKVRFSEDVEVFPIVDGESSEKTNKDDSLIRGKRFSKEEDEIVKMAVMSYIEEHALGDDGLEKVLHCRKFPELKNCWKDIGQALPHRPYLSVYYRAHILFERDETSKWTPEEYEIIRKYHEKHGSDWKALAEALGKHRFHVKDTWRRIKLPNVKKGAWTQDEYQNLFDLVNTDLRLKAFEEKKSKHGMLRDNICWGAISDQLSTRSTAICCQKWYRQLTSPMVAEDEWADIDDYRLVDALSSLDACSIEDVDWDQVLEHRNGDVCRKRWSQMVKHIGGNCNKSFSEQVEVLSKRYCPDVLDAREAYDNAPIVD